MQSLSRFYHNLAGVALKKVPFAVGSAAFIVILFSSLTFLALPARASLDSPHRVIGLDNIIILEFPFPIQRDEVEVEISPKVEFSYEWSGVLVNQKLKIKPARLLQPDETYQISIKNIKNLLGTSESDRSFLLKTEGLPKVVASDPEPGAERITPNPTFSFTLDKNVSYGSYELISSPYFETKVTQAGNKLEFVPLKPLAQNKEYFIGLQFNAGGLPIANLFGGDFLVVKPLKVIKTSPKPKIQNASKNSGVEIKFNKAIKPVFLGSYVRVKPHQAGQFEFVDKKTVKFTPKPRFETDTDYKITIDKTIEAEDGAVLEKDYVLKFKTAGPVTVVGSSPLGFGIPLLSNISVTFDQPVNKKSAEESFSVSPKVAGSFVWSGNTMTFVPNSVFNLFKQYSFSLAKGIKSPGGEPSNRIFGYNFTTTLEQQKRIGTSVHGRPITAYYFGVGAKKILLAGAMHGSESNTRTLLLNWVSYLRANQNLIPKDRTFIIVPNSNPDGVVKNDRFNAHRVDLNRNWDTPTWQKDTYWTYGKVVGGGGRKPFSEPETRALRDLINRENPRVTISYHSAAGVIISDGPSNKLRDWYSKKTGYTSVAGAPTPYEDEFSYDVTGSLEEWLGERGKIVVVVELATSYSSEYLRNLPALKGLLNYPL